MTISKTYYDSGVLESVIIDLNDNRLDKGFIEVKTRLNHRFDHVFVLEITDSIEQCTVGVTLGVDKLKILHESLTQMLAEAD